MNVCVLIPAYNEEKTLGELLCKLSDKGLSAVVVDDGSTDATARIARDSHAVLLRNEKNCGKGLSVKRGIDYLLGREDCFFILIMDGDLQHAPSDIDLFLDAAGRGEACVVGNRMKYPSGMPFLRIVTNRFMSWLISRITGQYIPDSQCGFRLIKKDILKDLSIETDNYQIESEILIKVAEKKIPITSVPVASIYRKDIKSKINPIIDTLRFIKFILFLHDKK